MSPQTATLGLSTSRSTDGGAAQMLRSQAGAAPAERSFDEFFAADAALDEAPPETELADAAGGEGPSGAEEEEAGVVENEGPSSSDGVVAGGGEAEELIDAPADPLRIIGGVSGARAARLTAAAVEIELTQAAQVDLASMHAAELSQAAVRPENPDAAPARPLPGAGPREGEGSPRGNRAGQAAPASAQSTPESRVESEVPAGGPPVTREPAPSSAASPAFTAASATAAQGGPGLVVQTKQTPIVGAAAAPVAAAGALGGSSAGSVPPVAGTGWAQRLLAIRTNERAGLPEAPRGEAKRPPEAIAQVQRGLAQLLRREGGSLTLRLTPERLGEVRIEIGVREGVVEAQIRAQTAEARSLLSESIDTLRAALESRGLRVERLVVDGPSAERSPGGAPEPAARDAGGAQAAAEHAGGEGPSDGGRRFRHGGGGGGPEDPAGTDEPVAGVAGRPRNAVAGRAVGVGGVWLGIDTLA